VTIVEVEEIVEAGVLKPDEIHLPGIYVDYIVKPTTFEKKIERVTNSKPKVSLSLPPNLLPVLYHRVFAKLICSSFIQRI